MQAEPAGEMADACLAEQAVGPDPLELHAGCLALVLKLKRPTPKVIEMSGGARVQFGVH